MPRTCDGCGGPKAQVSVKTTGMPFNERLFSSTSMPKVRGHSEDQHETQMQSWWDDAISKNMNLPDGYLKSSVLIIKWDSEVDQLHVEDEVRDLKKLFKNTFKYDVHIVELGIQKSQLQLEKEITSWAYEHDAQENLLIVYYAGHGVYDESAKTLELSPTNYSGYPGSKVLWNSAEKHFIDHVQADVLSIMDCCYASDLLRNVFESGRTFEMLAASQLGYPTASPGKHSFTRALIQCLEGLAKECTEGGSFTTRDIIERIQKERPAEPPALWRRLPGTSRHIRLSPMKLKQQPNEDKNRKYADHRGFLTLGFALRHHDLRKEQIDELTRHLPKAFEGCKVPIRDIKWLGCRKVKPSLADVAWQVRNFVRHSTGGGFPTPSSSNQHVEMNKRKLEDEISPLNSGSTKRPRERGARQRSPEASSETDN